MNILITGGAGYIGAHVVKLLRDRSEHDIHVVDIFREGRNNVLTHPRITYHEVDIRDKARLAELFAHVRPDVVFHFAALASVPDSVANPAGYYETNVVGTLNLLESMRASGTNKIVFSSSAATYGEPETEMIAEDHPQSPTNPYGQTKLIGEAMLADYFKAYGISSISFRYFCAAGADPDGEIGEHHVPETHIIPSILETIAGKREEFFVFGNDFPTEDGTGVRDYIHVMDLAEAHIAGMEKLLQAPVCARYNLGISKGFSVLELVAAAERATGQKLRHSVKSRRPGDPSRLIADARRAETELGWTPVYTDPESIIKTAYQAMQKRS